MTQSQASFLASAARSFARVVGFLLSLLCAVEAHATEFRCPSPEAFTFNIYVQAVDLDAALRAARERWSLKYLEKPTTCIVRAEYDAAYLKVLEPIIADEKSREAKRRSTVGADCPGLPGPSSEFIRGTWLVLSAPSGCMQTMSSRDQLFVAGATGRFAERCSIVVAGEALRFLTLALTTSPSEASPFFAGRTLASQGEDQKVCASQVPQQWIQGLSRYLSDTAHNPFSGFVQSCVNAYRDSVPVMKCTCAAEVLRLSNPNVYQQGFSEQTLQDGYKVSGLLGTALLSCLLPATLPPEPQVNVDHGRRRFYCEKIGSPYGGRKTLQDQALVMSRCLVDSDQSDQRRDDGQRAAGRAAAVCEGLAKSIDMYQQKALTENAAARLLPALEQRYSQQCR